MATWVVTVSVTKEAEIEVEVEASSREEAEKLALAEADPYGSDFYETDRDVIDCECLDADEDGKPIEEPEDVRMRRLGAPMLPCFAEAR